MSILLTRFITLIAVHAEPNIESTGKRYREGVGLPAAIWLAWYIRTEGSSCSYLDWRR